MSVSVTTDDKFTLTVYDSGYVDCMGLRVEGPDGGTVFDNPCYLGNEQFFTVDPTYAGLGYDEAGSLQGDLEEYRKGRRAGSIPDPDPNPEETPEEKAERWMGGDFDDDTPDFIRYMTDGEMEEYLRGLRPLLEGVLPEDYAPWDPPTRKVQLRDGVAPHFTPYWGEAVQYALDEGGTLEIAFTPTHKGDLYADRVSVEVIRDETGVFLCVTPTFRWGEGPHQGQSYLHTHDLPPWYTDRSTETRMRWLVTELEGYALSHARSTSAKITLTLVPGE